MLRGMAKTANTSPLPELTTPRDPRALTPDEPGTLGPFPSPEKGDRGGALPMPLHTPERESFTLR